MKHLINFIHDHGLNAWEHGEKIQIIEHYTQYTKTGKIEKSQIITIDPDINIIRDYLGY